MAVPLKTASVLLFGTLLPPSLATAQDSGAGQPQEFRITAAVVSKIPEIIKRVLPVYPLEMQRAGIRGDVVVDFIVDRHGNVLNPFAISSNNPAFEEPAILAVSQWKFKPGTVGGRAVNTHMQVPVQFEMDGYEGGYTDSNQGDYAYKFDGAPAIHSPIAIRSVRNAVWPYEMRRDGVTGHAEARALVDPSGTVIRVEILKATKPEFGLALEAAMDGFSFVPSGPRGKMEPVYVRFDQDFDAYAMPDPEVDSLLRLEKRHPEEIIHAVGSLDMPLHPVSRRPGIFPTGIQGAVDHGSALVEILIDKEGHARLPRIIEASDPLFGYAAVQAVDSWIFDAPTVGGKPVVVRVRIPFHFRRKKDSNHAN
jgi:TonB family protein